MNILSKFIVILFILTSPIHGFAKLSIEIDDLLKGEPTVEEECFKFNNSINNISIKKEEDRIKPYKEYNKSIPLSFEMAPTFINCPEDSILFLDENCSSIFTLIAPIIEDIDNAMPDGAYVTYSTTTGSGTDSFDYIQEEVIDFNYFGIGSLTIEWKAIDTFGMASSCFTEVTLQDTIPPSLSDDPPNSYGVYVDENCIDSFQLDHPFPLDNCGILSQIVYITYPDSSVVQEDMDPGVIFDYSYQGVGTITFDWTIIDLAGNEAHEYTYITLVDSISPTWDLNSIIILGQCGVDDVIELRDSAAQSLVATDNCTSNVIIELASPFPQITSNNCLSEGVYIYDYIAYDEFGNGSELGSVEVYFLDTLPPVISGIPNDITINCDGTFPDIPTPTSIDLCSGNLTSQLQLNIFTLNDFCGFAPITTSYIYEWTSTDECGNITVENWVVYIDSEASVSLGDDIVGCQGESYTLSTTGLSGDYYWSTGESTETIEVNQTGTYSVSVTSPEGCCAVDTINVTLNEVPDVLGIGGTIGCNDYELMIFGNSTTSNVTFSWTGPDSFSSNEQDPIVSQGGDYLLTVTAPNGCANSALVFVEDSGFQFSASVDSNDAVIYFETSVLLNECNCFEEFNNNGVLYAVKIGTEVVYEEILFPNQMDLMFIDTLNIDEVGPNIENLYSASFSQVGPGTVNCIKESTGTTLPFKVPTLFASNNSRPDSIHLSWVNKSSLTSGFRIFRDDELIHTMNATNGIDIEYNFTDAYNFTNSSLINGESYTYKVETTSNIYQAVNGTPFVPQKAEAIGSTYPINLEASDLEYDDKVVLNWNDLSAYAESIRINKDGIIIAVLPKSATSYENNNPIHGKLEEYSLEMISNNQVTMVDTDMGWTESNGLIDGKVLTIGEKIPVANAEIKLKWSSDNGMEYTDSLMINSNFDGSFSFDDLFYDATRDYVVEVSKGVFSFVENVKNITLDLDQPKQNDIIFLMDFDYDQNENNLSTILSLNTLKKPELDLLEVQVGATKASLDTTYFNVYRDSRLIHQFNDTELSLGDTILTFEDKNGVPGEEYNYTLHAYHIVDSTLIDTLLSVIDTFPDVYPVQSVTGTLTSQGTALFNWSHTSTNNSGFRLYREYEQPQLIYEGQDLTAMDLEGRPGEVTEYFITSFRTVENINYESDQYDISPLQYPDLVPININVIEPLNADRLDVVFTIPNVYTSDYNYDGVQIVRSYQGIETILKELPKVMLSPAQYILYEDRSGVPLRNYLYSVKPIKYSEGIAYTAELNDEETVQFPNVSIALNLNFLSEVGKINLNWDTPHTSDNYDGFIVYKSLALDSIGFVSYGANNSFVDYTYNPPNSLPETYNIVTSRTVDGVRYLSDPVAIMADPPIAQGVEVTILQNFTGNQRQCQSC